MVCELGSAILARLKHDKHSVDQLRVGYKDKFKDDAYLQQRDRLDRVLMMDVRDMTQHRDSCLVCRITNVRVNPFGNPHSPELK